MGAKRFGSASDPDPQFPTTLSHVGTHGGRMELKMAQMGHKKLANHKKRVQTAGADDR